MDDAERIAKRVYCALGAQVRARRKGRKWTQEHLGGLMGVDSREVRRVEKGDNVSILMLVRLSRAFQVEIGELFGAMADTGSAKSVAAPSHARRRKGV